MPEGHQVNSRGNASGKLSFNPDPERVEAEKMSDAV
jgi:hypothetical protein